MDRILVGAEAAEYLKSHVTQHVQETGKGIRITIDRSPNVQKLELGAILALIDSALADKPNEEVEANLYSARLHMKRALQEVA